ncbi:MAG: type IV secretion protein IcmL [Alphaproteobacteria bacterium]|nr:type IV secretion protein IcmL [Alphaproteobacteria bacterium]
MVDTGQNPKQPPEQAEEPVAEVFDEEAEVAPEQEPGAPQTEVAARKESIPQSEMPLSPAPAPRRRPAAQPQQQEVGGFAGFMRKLFGNKNPPPPPAGQQQPAKAAGVPAQRAAGGAPARQQPGQKPAPVKPVSGPLMTIVTRNEFYRDGFRNLIKIAVLQGLIIVGLILTIIVYINNAQPQDRYFATTADGRIMQLLPLNAPNLDDAALLSWVSSAVTDTMSFSYLNYQKELQKSSRNFTRSGWTSFTTALQKSRILDSVQAQQQLVTSQPRAAPVLLQKGVYGGKYRWRIQMPLAVTYRSPTDSRTDSLNLDLVVERVPSLENASGVGIVQWIATSR